MAKSLFIPTLPAASQPHKFAQGDLRSLAFVDSFKLRTLLGLAAAVQLAVQAALPLKWAVVPVGVVLSASLLKTVLQLLDLSGNDFQRGVVPGRVTAQVPSLGDGQLGPLPANGPVVVFQLGIQFNHPLGMLAPSVREISGHYAAMAADLLRRRDDFGLLSISKWRGMERGSNNTLLTTFYFRDVESVHRFAHEELHRRALGYFHAAQPAHIGIFHETYLIGPGDYESVYVGSHPVLLGRGVAKSKAAAAGGEAWVNTLVDANTPALKTQYARLRRNEDGSAKDFGDSSGQRVAGGVSTKE